MMKTRVKNNNENETWHEHEQEHEHQNDLNINMKMKMDMDMKMNMKWKWTWKWKYENENGDEDKIENGDENEDEDENERNENGIGHVYSLEGTLRRCSWKTCDETDWIVTNYERVWPPACCDARKNNNDSTVQSGFGGFGEMFCYHFGILGFTHSDMKPVKHETS